jgi:hypothetical protein
MNFYNHPSKIKKVFSAILPGILVAGLIFAANTYYDLDLGKVIVQEITRIVGQLETSATTTLATLGGNVGIGTTAPAYKLEVIGTGRFSSDLTVSGNLTVSGSGPHSFAGTLSPTNVSAFTLTGNITGSGSPNITGIGQFSGSTGVFSSSVTTPLVTSTAALTLSSGGTSALTLDSASGLIVLNDNLFFEKGTYDLTLAVTAPTANVTLTIPALSTNGNLVVDNLSQTLTNKTLSTGSTWQGNVISVTYGGTGLSSVASGTLLYGSGGTSLNTLPIGASGTILTSSGSAPQWSTLSSLNIVTGSGTANTIPKWTGTSTLGNSIITDDGSLVTVSGQLQTTGTTTLATTAGNVGIGTTAPAQKLTVAGNIGIQAGANAFIGTLDNYALSLRTNNTDRVFITNAGNVGIGTTAPSQKLHVVGNALITGTGTFQTSPLTIGNLVLSHTGLTASRTFTFPDVSDTLVSLTATQTLTNKTLSTGSTWQGNVISTTYGGTGLSSYTAGDILYYSSGTSLSKLPIGASGTILTSSGSAPQWSTLSSLNIVTGSGTANTIAKWTGTSTLGNSIITDDGSLVTVSGQFRATGTTTLATTQGNVGIGTTAPTQKLHVEGQCVTGDTKLAIFEQANSLPLTAHRVKEVQIKDVKPGQYVYSLNEKTGKVEPAKINKLLDMGVKPVFKLVTDSGKEIKTTGNHPYLAITQNSKVKSQNDNSKFKNINPYHLTEEYEFSETKVIWENKKSNFLISNSSMLDMSDLDDIGFNKNELHSIISNPQSILLKLPSFELLYFGILKGMVEPTELFNLFNNLAMNFEGQSMKFFFSSGMEKAFEHKENNYLFSLLSRALNLLSTSFKDIQDLSRSASFTLSSVSPIAEGLDHSIRSTISSNNSLERNFEGAKTPRMFSSSMIVNGSDFAIQSNGSKDENELSMAKWTKVIYLEPGDEIATVEFNCKQSAVSCEPYLSWEKIKSIEFVGYEQVYDIEVEGTHNFVANGILAHNTYISGNVGIGTTAPSAKLHSLATTEQLRLGYDASNAVKFTVGSTNALTITPLVNNTSGFNFTNAAGTSILNIDTSNQRVGIGTTAPEYKLQIIDDTETISAQTVFNVSRQGRTSDGAFNNTFFQLDSFSGGAFAPGGSHARLTSARGTRAAPTALAAGDRLGTLLFAGYGTAYVNSAAIAAFAEEAFGATAAGTYLRFETTPLGSTTRAERMRITADGNVGIGTTGPASLLELYKADASPILTITAATSTTFSPQIAFRTGTTPSTKYTIGTNIVDNKLKIIVGSDISTSTGITIDSSGNVGIGTTGPSAKLHVVGPVAGSGPTIRAGGGGDVLLGSGGSLFFDDNYSYSTGNYIRPVAANTQAFFTSGAERMRITSTGNVGIGTTAPSYKLDVASGGAYTARFGTNASDTVVIGGGAGKLSVGTFDPVYNIGGKKFATYGLSTIGIKEETVGTIKIERKEEGKDYYFAEIDFNNLTEGSDLWLFSKITALKKNINKLSVFLTPNSRTHVWYQVDPENFKLYFFAEKPTIISYRLIAPRFDFEKWKNTLENEEGITGLIVEEDGEVATSSFYKLDEENNKEGLLEKISSLFKTFFEELEIFFEKGKMFVEKLLTKEIETEKITTQKICSKNGKCVEVTDELIEKLNNLQQTTNNSQPTPTPEPNPTPSPSPTPELTPNPETSPTPETTSTEQPTLTSSP